MEYSDKFKEYLDSIGAREVINSLVEKMTKLENDNETLRSTVEQLSNSNEKLFSELQILATITVPIGTILSYGGRRESIPDGWLLCNGEHWLSKEKYLDLFTAIGYAWGKSANNPNVFKIPDLRGQFLRGVDYGKGLDPDTAHRKNGESIADVGSFQNDATKMPGNSFKTKMGGKHQHNLSPYHKIWVDKHMKKEGGEISQAGPSFGEILTNFHDGHKHEIVGGDTETRPKNAYVNFIIRVK